MQKTPYYIGLDIGSSKVRCVVGMIENKESQNVLSVIGVGSSLNHGMRKGNIIHADEVAKAIVEAVSETERMAGIRITHATINVNGAHIKSEPSHGLVAISNPSRLISDDDRVRVEEAASLVALPANREIIQIFARNYRIDGQDNIKDPIGMKGLKLEVDALVLTAGTPMLRTLDYTLNKAQIEANHHTVSGLAAAEAVIERKQKETGVAIVDIGAGTTNIVVLEEGEVVYVAVIPIGSQNITNDLAIGLKTDLDIAENVKIKHANLNDTREPKDEISVDYESSKYVFSEKIVKIVIEARLEELFEQVDKEFKKIGKSKRLPGGVVLVGAAANMPGIADFAKDKLQLPVKIGKISDEIGGLIDSINCPEYATAIGLMMLDMLLSERYSSSHYGFVLNNSLQITSNVFTKIKRIVKK